MEFFAIFSGILALAFALYLIREILKFSQGSEKMKEIGRYIHAGAVAFLKREVRAMVPILGIIAILLGFFISFKEAFTFLIGVMLSLLAGYIGMQISTRANVRSAQAASESLAKTFKVAFSGGTVMGMTVVGLGLLGLVGIYLLFDDPELLIGYAFGSSLTALFLRVGGGIYTKSADVGADLVGKVESGIPEDDPRNPAVIADAVGDNVGDIAGMGSDLFESYVSAIIATIVLGIAAGIHNGVALPLALASAGIICSIVGSFFVRVSKKTAQQNFSEQTEEVSKAMNRGVIIANLLMVGAAFFLVRRLCASLDLFWAVAAGLVAGFLIGKATEFYTSHKYKPVLNIARSSETGASTNIIEGLSQGMISTIVPVVSVAAAIVIAYYFGGLYGIAISSVGILVVLGLNLSIDSYGPIVDNAAGIAEMSGMPKEVRFRADALDSVGNTTAAIGKGFAIGSAALASLAWLVVFFEKADLHNVVLLDPKVIAGLFIGALLPFVFSAFALKAVGRGGFEIIKEVRRQFEEIPGLREGRANPDYEKCVDITTKRAIKEMLVPGLIVILTPVFAGFVLGLVGLGALLTGALVCGFLLAVMMANAGGAWDNAKKYIESGYLGGKGSLAHKAAIVGDTVGDPFKDTAGPSLNILIKLIGKVALVSVPFLVMFL